VTREGYRRFLAENYGYRSFRIKRPNLSWTFASRNSRYSNIARSRIRSRIFPRVAYARARRKWSRELSRDIKRQGCSSLYQTISLVPADAHPRVRESIAMNQRRLTRTIKCTRQGQRILGSFDFVTVKVTGKRKLNHKRRSPHSDRELIIGLTFLYVIVNMRQRQEKSPLIVMRDVISFRFVPESRQLVGRAMAKGN